MRLAQILLAVTLGGGCKGGAPAATTTVNMETPRGTADGLVKAFAERNSNLAVSLLPPVDLLKAHFDCPGDELGKAVQQRRERATKDFADVPKGLVMEIGQFDKSGSSDKQLRAGDEWQGCKAKKIVTVHESKVDLRMIQDGKTDFDGETWTFLKFGDEAKWYYFR